MNMLVKDQMRAWLVESAQSALETLDTKKRATSTLLWNVATLLKDQGKYDEAEPLYREAAEGHRRELGDLLSYTTCLRKIDDAVYFFVSADLAIPFFRVL